MAISDETRKCWDDKLAEIETAAGLTEWEEEFVDSLSIRRSRGLDLTHKQSKKLNEVLESYRKRTEL